MANQPRRLAHEVLERIVAEVPEGTEFHRVAKHVLDSLAYQAPEVAWHYASTRMEPAFHEASRIEPRPEWFNRVVGIWLETEGQVAS
jgi:hypothetical protein